MQVFAPGDHGSTFGGNPLAAAVGLAALDVLFDEKLIERSAEMGAHLLERLRTIKSPLVKDVRGKGLFVGLEVDRVPVSRRAMSSIGCSRAGSCRRIPMARSSASPRRSSSTARRSTGRSRKCARFSPSSAMD